jgi:DNA-binding IclR family transcriptional regulator
MNDRNQKILDVLSKGDETCSNMALILGIPQPSIRRSVQELRREGHNICFADIAEQTYRLGLDPFAVEGD